MRIAIVNDMMMAVEALRRVLATVPAHQIAWVALDGVEAVEKCAADTPDLILMDLIMPNMDGVEATRRIMQETPCAILVVTATVHGNASKVFEAMGHGALDAVNTPVLGADGRAEGGEKLLKKIETIGQLIGRRSTGEHLTETLILTPPPSPDVPPLVVIGASTGGPKALVEVFARLPESFGAGVVVVQHVSAQFAPGLMEWLKNQTPLKVRLAREGDKIEAGVALLSGTDDHMVMGRDRTLRYTPEPRTNPYCPSVDVFFTSVAAHWPGKSVAVILTGMGRDGARGMLDLYRSGWHTIVQDESTSVIYGMPKAAVEVGAATEILPIEEIGPALVGLVANTEYSRESRDE